MPKPYGYWTRGRLATLRRRYPAEGASRSLAEKLGVCAKTLRKKARELGPAPVPWPKGPRPAPLPEPAPPPPPATPAPEGDLGPREEARRNRARQLARVLLGEALSAVDLAECGWTVEAVEALRREGPEWFTLSLGLWSLTPQGQADLLGGRVGLPAGRKPGHYLLPKRK